MSLLSTDITKVKRLSLKEIKLPAPELRVELITPILVERPPSNEEIAYSKLVAINPLIEELVERLKLVSTKTGERIKKLDLSSLAERSYSKEVLIEWIKEEAKIDIARAERGFIFMLENRMIQPTINPELYYLTGSTPF